MNDDTPVTWPPSAQALTDHTRCPQCFAALTSERCSSCGIDLAGPDALTLASLGDAVVAAERSRSRFIADMRQRQAEATEAAADATREVPAAAIAEIPTPTPATSATAAPAPTVHAAPSPARAPRPAADPARPRVQVLLLTLGITLLGVAAVFFTTLAYLFTSPELRAGILALAAVAVTGIAAALHSRVPRTAHFLSALSVIILVIDAAMIRGFELFGTAALDPLVFLGLVAAALCVLTGALSTRPLFPAFRIMSQTFAPIAGFGLAQVVPGWPLEQALWLGFVAATAATTVWAAVMRPRPGLERQLTLGFQLGAALLATLLAWGLRSGGFSLWRGDDAALTIVTMAGTVALWTALALQLRGTIEVRFAAVMAGAVLSLGVARLRPLDFGWGTVALTLVGAALPIGAALLAARLPRLRVQLRFGAFAMLGVAVAGAALAVLVPMVTATGDYRSIPYLTTELATASRFSVSADGLLAVSQQTVLVLGSLALIGLSLRQLGLLTRLAPGYLALIGAGVLSLASGIDARASENPFDADTGLRAILLLAASALGIAALPRLRAGASRVVISCAVAVFLGFTLATAPNFAPVWCLVAAIVIGLLLFWRAVIDGDDARSLALRRSVLSGAAFGVVLVAGVLLGALGRELAGPPLAPAPVIAGVALIAGFAVVASTRRSPGPEREVLAGLSLLALVAALIVDATGSSVHDTTATPVLIGLGLSALLGVLWQLHPALRRAQIRPAFAALATTAALAFTVVLADDRDWALTVPLGVCLLLLTLAARALPGGALAGASRLGWEIPLALAALALFVGAWTNPRTGWLGYGLLAAAALVAASDDAGPERGAFARRRLAWIAVPAGAAMLWTFLAHSRVEVIEAYTVPVGVGLIVLGLALALRDRARSLTEGLTVLVLGGLALALLPSAVVGSLGSTVRPILVTVLGFGLLALVAALPALVERPRLRGGVLGIAAIAIAIAPTYRAVTTVSRDGFPAATDAWLLVLIALTAAIFALEWRTEPLPERAALSALGRGTEPLPERAPISGPTAAPAPIPFSFALLVRTLEHAATLVTAGVIVAALLQNDSGVARPVIATVLFAVLAAAAALMVPPRHVLVGIGAVSAAVIAVIGMLSVPKFAPELFSVPVAVIAVIAAAMLLRRMPQRRTLPTLGWPLALLLVPSLVASWVDPELWRLVGLGVIAVAVVIAGAVLAWQAPLVVGGSVLLVHALVQLFPAIRALYETVPWGIWAAIGGIALVAFGATYEARMAQAKALGRRVAELR